VAAAEGEDRRTAQDGRGPGLITLALERCDEALARGALDEAAVHLAAADDALAKAEPGHRFRIALLLLRVELEMRRGDPARALRLFDERVASAPGDPELRFHRAEHLEVHGDVERAIAAYREAQPLAAAPEQLAIGAAVAEALSRALLSRGAVAEAEQVLMALVERTDLAPRDPPKRSREAPRAPYGAAAVRALASIWVDRGSLAPARTLLSNALVRLEATGLAAPEQLAGVATDIGLLELAQERRVEAEAAFDRAIEHLAASPRPDPAATLELELMAASAALAGPQPRPASAKPHLHRALSIATRAADPRLADVLRTLSVARLLEDDAPGAESLAREALAIDERAPSPQIAAALSANQLGATLLAQARTADAQRAFDRAAKLLAGQRSDLAGLRANLGKSR